MRRSRDSWYHTRRPKYSNERITELFKILRKQGLVARQSFRCCGGCASYELATTYGEKRDAGQWENIKGMVFYHKQAAERLHDTGKVNLTYGQVEHYVEGQEMPKYVSILSTEDVGLMIARAAQALKIKCEWDGNPDHTIVLDITPDPAYLGENI